ncbi:MAG: segregation/condensation protein A [Anaerolineales bacterium]|nr:segregation/condensation protein A [Anaerolineales bacterium]
MSSIIGSMDSKFSTEQVSEYKINTPVYQGPLDLLLQLIENAELDITTLALAEVTDQYLKHLEQLQDLPPDEISVFLVIAAKLIQIKSEALLPQQSTQWDEEIDIGDDLARQLIAYKRYKEIADLLAERKDLGYQTFIRLSPPEYNIKDNLDLDGFGVNELYSLASSIFQKEIARQSISTVVERPKITIKDKINQISARFKNSDELTFHDLLGENYSKMDIVISFLALLELVKGNYIKVVQDSIFTDIKMVRVKEVAEMEEFALKNLEL